MLKLVFILFNVFYTIAALTKSLCLKDIFFRRSTTWYSTSWSEFAPQKTGFVDSATRSRFKDSNSLQQLSPCANYFKLVFVSVCPLSYIWRHVFLPINGQFLKCVTFAVSWIIFQAQIDFIFYSLCVCVLSQDRTVTPSMRARFATFNHICVSLSLDCGCCSIHFHNIGSNN